MADALWGSLLVGPESEWFWVMCQFVAVTVTLWLILRQVRLQNDSHLVNSFATFGDRWNSQMMLKARRDVCARYTPERAEVDATMHHLCLFFEEIGIYCSKKVLSLDVAWELYSFEIEHYWAITKNAIISFRKQQGDDTFYFHFERLYRDVHRLSARKGAPTRERTQDDLEKFRKHEKARVEFFLEGPARPTDRDPPAGRKRSTS